MISGQAGSQGGNIYERVGREPRAGGMDDIGRMTGCLVADLLTDHVEEGKFNGNLARMSKRQIFAF